MYRSSVSTVGSADLPDYIYYNADIINNESKDLSADAITSVRDPDIRFNETRDAALVKDASQYYFSIIRFTMNGANKDLPLFIPNIQEGTGQTDVNLTSYSMAIPFAYTNTFTDVGTQTLAVAPTPRFIEYVSETQNPLLAPIPRTLANPRYVGLWSPTRLYLEGDIVTLALDPKTGIGLAPFYEVVNFPVVGVPPPANGWDSFGADEGGTQDITSRYYWVYTYEHWVDLVNRTLLDPASLTAVPGATSTCVWQDTYNALATAWTATGTVDPFPYATLADFQAYVNCPQMSYNPDSKRFSMIGDMRAFGPVSGVSVTPRPVARLFFNTNMYGLFTSFDNIFYNVLNLPATDNFPAITVPPGYVNEILFNNKNWTNVLDYSVAPYTTYVPVINQQKFWVAEQDWQSTDSLWSPISSIVFTSTLIPIRAEQTGPPVVLGTANLGVSAATAQSAFSPIVTDIALDTSSGGADAYRRFIYYTPFAEYRLSDLAASKQDIRNIDIQVYWKSRLDNQLYPIQMFNLTTVSIKCMFRHKNAHVTENYSA